jgi:uncharacterized membrane protein YcfT
MRRSDPVPWVACLKGACLLLVVGFHAGVMLQMSGREVNLLYTLEGVLGFAVLPLLFLCSGLAAEHAVERSWWWLLRRRLLRLVYLLLVWSVLRWCFMRLVDPSGAGKTQDDLLVEVLTALVTPTWELWFLWALAACLVLAKLALSTGRPWLVTGLAAAATLASYSHLFQIPHLAYGGTVQYALYFLIGCFGRRLLLSLSKAASPALAAALAFGYLALAFPAHWSDGAVRGALGLAASLVAVPAGVAAASVLARWSPARRILAPIGWNSLPIYLTHILVLALAVPAILAVPSTFGFLVPLLAIGTPVLLGLAVVRLAGRGPLAVLFVPPGLGGLKSVSLALRARTT